ncbi:16S rRNA (cytosine(1402)-N(4))-methyltransferase RsmH [Candidatus Saccharibacteria bacterium]|nr:16S rRNA (cytosine(1402)-N(4))-methyltransferase RsmH [Candidatus Saccharibacteria bacterium]
MVEEPQHVPVLLECVLKYLDPKPGESYLDLTAGYGGHASAMLERTLNSRAVLVDRDGQAIAYLRRHFKDAEILHSDFLSAAQKLVEQGERFDMILADLGVSSYQLGRADRGFSIKLSGPLDMRMDPTQHLSADRVVNEWDEKSLAIIFRDYGQEPKARTIARKIITNRPINTTDKLAAIVASAWQGRSRTHPATRTFQAIRIAVNEELTQLERSLPLLIRLLVPGGRLAVISFHSLEDRIIKSFFAEHAADTYDSELKLLTKKPLRASDQEIAFNPRARSAKLRAAAKIKK